MTAATQSLLLVAILFANASVSAGFRYRARRQETIPRSRESRGLRLLRAGLALPVLVVLVASILSPESMRWAGLPIATQWRWLGAALGFAAVPLNVWVLSSLGSNVSETVLTKESHELVTAGPYRWVRHPLYTTGFAMLIAFSLVAASAALAVLTLITFAGIRGVIVPREELELERRFGAAYRDYRSRTGALLPRLLPRRGR